MRTFFNDPLGRDILNLVIVQMMLVLFTFIAGWEWREAAESTEFVGPALWTVAAAIVLVAMSLNIRRLLNRIPHTPNQADAECADAR